VRPSPSNVLFAVEPGGTTGSQARASANIENTERPVQRTERTDGTSDATTDKRRTLNELEGDPFRSVHGTSVPITVRTPGGRARHFENDPYQSRL